MNKHSKHNHSNLKAPEVNNNNIYLKLYTVTFPQSKLTFTTIIHILYDLSSFLSIH